MPNIRCKVRNLVRKYNTRNPLILAKNLGINVEFEKLELIKGYATIVLRKRFIVISSLLDELSLQIVAAHEVGHHLLHPIANGSFLREYTLFPIGRYEVEANRFAAEFLIDETDIDELLLRDLSTDQIANYYGVPRQLVEYKFHIKI